MNKGSIPRQLLTWLADAICRRPRWFILPPILLFGFSIWYTIPKESHYFPGLQFDMSRNSLVGADKKYHQIFLQFKKDFVVRDDFVVVVESEDQEKNRQFVERLGAKLEARTNLFSQIFYKGDLKMLGPRALLFLDEPTLIELQKTLGEYEPFIAQFSKATNLNALFSLVNQQFRRASRETNAETASMIESLPALRRIIDQARGAIVREGTAPSPGLTALFGESSDDGQYITFGNGRLYLVNARTHSDKQNGEAIRVLRQLANETYAEVPGVNVGITGEPVLEYDEMQQSQKDSTLATVVSLVICALLFIVSYRETGRPLKATAALILGLGYTIGYTTWAVGHLNILTVTFVPILIGLAIDFGIHLITRYEEELRRGESEQVAIHRAVVNTGLGIFTGCLTTAGAFFAMTLTDFKGIREMGIITGGGMIVCLLPMMTFLPAVLLRGRQNRVDQNQHAEESARARLERLWLERPRTVVVVVVIGTLLALIPMRRVYFDYNLLHMQSQGLPAVIFEHKLIDSASKSVLYAAVIAQNREEALALESKLTNLATVATIDTMAHYVGGDQSAKIQLIDKIKRGVAAIRFAEPDTELANVDELSRTLWSLNGYLGLALDELEGTQPELVNELRALRSAIEQLRYEMLNRERRVVARQLAAYQQRLFHDVRETFRAIRTQDNSAALNEETLPEFLRTRFIGAGGKHLLQVYPKGDVWDRAQQEAFVKELRTVAPNVTGTPVQLYEYTTLLKDSYVEAAYYALGAIVVLTLLHFRSVGAVLLALLPVGIGTLWTCGIMGLFGVPFNPANIMILPLVVGIGVTNGIHILNRFAEEKNPTILGRSTGKAVIVSGLTTIAGFGSLMIAKHQGIQSLGMVMSVGVAMCMLAAVTVLPALLTLKSSGKVKTQ